jgi:hypothetical protein
MTPLNALHSPTFVISTFMSPHFGQLSAERIDLKGLTKHEAMGRIRKEIRQVVRLIAPPHPPFHLPHEPDHPETGPWLYIGTDGQSLHAGRWYQTVSYRIYITFSL